jgi:hypothetical protein
MIGTHVNAGMFLTKPGIDASKDDRNARMVFPHKTNSLFDPRIPIGHH